ncbi:MAG: CAP domain-containing protein [Elainellaceae cyanobacterium]
MARDRAGNSARAARNITLQQGRNVFRDAVSRSDKTDFYRFSVGSSSRLSVSLSKLTANADITLLDRGRNVIARSQRRGRRAERIGAQLEPGTYFIRVSRRQGSTRYKLNLRYRPTSAPETFVPSTESPDPGVDSPPSNTSLNAPVESFASDPLVQGVLTLTNAARQDAGLAPLQLDNTLSTVALGHSQNMALGDFFGHADPSGNRNSDRVSAANYGYRSIAENIGAGFSTAEGVVNAWLESPGHRANILNPRLTEIGIGYYSLANDTGNVNYNHYWTQVFAQPLL